MGRGAEEVAGILSYHNDLKHGTMVAPLSSEATMSKLLILALLLAGPSIANAPPMKFEPFCQDGQLAGLAIHWLVPVPAGGVAVRFPRNICEGKDA